MAISSVAALREAVEAIEKAIGRVHCPLGMVLGSGLGGLASEVERPRRMSYSDIPRLAASTVPGHAGELVTGTWQGRDVVMLSGRVHAYEGHDFIKIALPVQLLAALGVEVLIITNAAGTCNADHRVGDLMTICDHINLMGNSPLTGVNDDRLGPRFPDMTVAYDAEFRRLALDTAARQRVRLHEGVYAGVLGPSYETPAEVRMIRLLGADAIGMSTVPEVIAARHLGMRVLGLSCLTNKAAGLGNGTLDHGHVSEVAGRSTAKMGRLIKAIVRDLPPLVARDETAERIRSARR